MGDAPKSVGPYQIVEPIGAGGMGEVYKALDTRVGRHVALKLLPESLAQDSERRRRFEQEAKLAAALNHPNVMAIYDVGLDHQPPYIVCELVPGESLRAIVANGPMAPRRATDIAAQIAAGLAAAHSAGIVHRDLKPENVIVTPEGAAKILDFGVARLSARPIAPGETATIANTQTGAVIGTAAYMSPEQARGLDVDYRSDQFALGLVLYEMLGGRQPFARSSAVQTMAAIVEDEPPPLDRPVPAQLRWILDRCLAKEREGRYESTRDLARELAQLRDRFGELTAAGTSTGAQPVAVKSRRRWPILTASVTAGALAAWMGAALRHNPAAVDLSQYRLTPFATSLPSYSVPSWSPDGKSLAFVGNGLMIQPFDGPSAVQLTAENVSVNSTSPPFWSPDGRFLYFKCTIAPRWGLCRIPAGGGEAAVIQERARAGALSMDGKSLVTIIATPDEKSTRVWISSPPEAPPRLYEPMPFDAGNVYNLPALAFSPDGKQILAAINFDTHGETMWLLPWPPGKARQLLAGGNQFLFTPQFDWFPDSRHVAFSDSTSSQHASLYALDTTADRFWPILIEDREAQAPSVSPDGSRIAYASGLSHTDIVGAPLDGGPIQTVLGSSRDEMMASASPAGPQIVYVTDRRGVMEIWISSAAEDRLVTSPSKPGDAEQIRFFMDPVFSPDGKRIAFNAGTPQGTRLYTVFASGGSVVRATSGGIGEFAPTWSPDGAWLAYYQMSPTNSLLRKVRPGSGEPPATLAETGSGTVPEWSPAGDWIAFHDPSGKPALISPDGKNRRELPGGWGPFAWSRDGKTLYQARMDPPALYAVDVASNRDRKLRDLAGVKPFSGLNPGLRLSLTSDGKSLIYTVLRARQEIWILDGVQWERPWWRSLLP